MLKVFVVCLLACFYYVKSWCYRYSCAQPVVTLIVVIEMVLAALVDMTANARDKALAQL